MIMQRKYLVVEKVMIGSVVIQEAEYIRLYPRIQPRASAQNGAVIRAVAREEEDVPENRASFYFFF